jgi:hypothetical protein
MSVEVGGGEVLLEVSVDKTGAVTAMKPLRETATFTERMTQTVKTWRFEPALADIPASRRKPGGPATEARRDKDSGGRRLQAAVRHRHHARRADQGRRHRIDGYSLSHLSHHATLSTGDDGSGRGFVKFGWMRAVT